MPLPTDKDWYRVDRDERHIVSFGWNGGAVKLCQVQFHHTGIFVHFPYHPDVEGIVSRVHVPPGGEGTHSLEPGGAITSHKVKYSHHISGNAHFSQDGKVRTSVRGSAAELSADGGHIFSLDVQGLSSFRDFTTADYYGGKYGRGYFELQGEEPESVHIAAYWKLLRGRSIELLRNPALLRGPGGVREVLAIAPPAGAQLGDGLLLLDASTRSALDRSAGFLLLFTGGFEDGLADPEAESAFLALQYPASETASLPSIDLPT